jgi:diketogulonate reductase-like aldo/keto reductase
VSRRSATPRTLDSLLEIARQHGKSAAQVMLRGHPQEGRSAIPKSTKPARLTENFDVSDFELTTQQLAAIVARSTPESAADQTRQHHPRNVRH